MGLKKGALSESIKSLVDSNARDAFRYAMNTPYTHGEPEQHVERMAVRFGQKFSENFPDQLASEIDLYVRAAFAIHVNTEKDYPNGTGLASRTDRNSIRFDNIWQNTAARPNSTEPDNTPSLALTPEVLKYIERNLG